MEAPQPDTTQSGPGGHVSGERAVLPRAAASPRVGHVPPRDSYRSGRRPSPVFTLQESTQLVARSDRKGSIKNF